MNENNQLIKIIEESGLAPIQAKPLLDSFGVLFVTAHKLVAQSKGIKVTSEDQVEEMKKARELRTQLKNLRNDADRSRIALKEGYLRGGNAVQAIYNDIRNVIKPEEDRLEEQEKFAEIMEAKREAEKLVKRTEILSKYVEDITIYTLAGMSDEAFDALVKNSKEAFEAKKQAEIKAEEDRILEEKKQAKEREKISLENIKLKKIAEAKQKLLLEERKKAETQRKIQEEQLRKEREAREKAEAEIRAKKEAELKAKREDDEKKRNEELEKLKAEKAARLAPDKEKMRVVYKAIQLVVSEIQATLFVSEEARGVAGHTIIELQKTMINMAERMKKL